MERIGRRDFIHQMSATLAVVAATYRSIGVPPSASGVAPVVVGEMTWTGDQFMTSGELQVLRKYALAAARDGAGDEAIDHLLTVASLVDAPAPIYRETLAALRPVCVATGRPRAATTIDWYLGRKAMPDDAYDAACSRLARGEELAAAIGFDRIGFPAHAAHALERAGRTNDARQHYAIVATRASSVARALAVFGAARLSAPGAARDRAIAAAITHARRSIDSTTPRAREIVDSLERGDCAIPRWDPPVATPAADRFRFVAAPPWIEPMIDEEAGDIAQLCAPLLLARARLEQRVSPSAADFALRRAMVTRLLALELATATGDRCALLATSLHLRLSQLGDERFTNARAAVPVAA